LEKVALEVCEAEFERFAEAWDLDTDVATMEEEDRDSFRTVKRRITRAIGNGSATVNDDGSLTYAFRFSSIEGTESLTFRVPSGNAILQWDRYKERQSIHKLNSFLGNMTSSSPAIFAKIDGRDIKVCQAVAQLFLGS
jgi:hypothetical protein